jgi:nitrate reductase delta subunit
MKSTATATTTIHAALADLLEYPDRQWQANLAGHLRAVEACGPGPAAEAARFARGLAGCSTADLQEEYTRTFDLNPVCTLEIGYHLFGENYKRGAFLARLRETEAPFALGQEKQLPDHLPVLLRLLDRLEDSDLRASLIADCLIPALDKMLKALSQTGNIYGPLLSVTRSTLELDAPSRRHNAG